MGTPSLPPFYGGKGFFLQKKWSQGLKKTKYIFKASSGAACNSTD